MSSRHLPVCAPCERELRCDRNSVMVDYGDNQFLAADRYVCDGCGTKIVVGFCAESFELPADAPLTPDKYQKVRQPQFPDYCPTFRVPLVVVK